MEIVESLLASQMVSNLGNKNLELFSQGKKEEEGELCGTIAETFPGEHSPLSGRAT